MTGPRPTSGDGEPPHLSYVTPGTAARQRRRPRLAQLDLALVAVTIVILFGATIALVWLMG